MQVSRLNQNELNNYIDMTKDMLAGDANLVDSVYKDAMGLENLHAAIEWLKQNDMYGDYKNILANEGWRLTYYRKPPTPEEFLTAEWLGPQAETMWPNVRKAFLEFMDPNPMNPFRFLALSVSIGWGKSFLTNLIMSYLVVLFGLMRDPYKQLGHSVVTSYCLGLCAATLDKAWDILGTPFEQFLESNPYFEKVGRRDDIVAINREDKECKKSYYTTAGRGSTKMLFRNNLGLKLVSTEGALLGNAQPLDEKIMLPDGNYTEMGKLKVGDKIASPTEGETTVTGVYPQGKRPTYEIELEDGRKVRASDNHLWKISIEKDSEGKWIWEIKTTLELISLLEKGIEIEIYDESNSPEVKLPA